MAEGMGDKEGKVVACEKDPYLVKFVTPLLEDSPHSNKIDIRQGPYLDTIKALAAEGEKFDLIVLKTADKKDLAYYQVR